MSISALSCARRALVERVMGFCDNERDLEFTRSAPEFERMLMRSGILY